MNQNLFLNNIAEVKLTYTTKVSPSERAKITCSKDAVDIFRHVFPGFEHREYFYVMLLNRGNKVLGIFLVSVGGLAGTIVDVRLILQATLIANSSSIVLAHNHPSGTLEASDADIRITRKIKEACSFLDISLLDHLIITHLSHLSMADQGLF
jgi:DNA repair protein RadC